MRPVTRRVAAYILMAAIGLSRRGTAPRMRTIYDRKTFKRNKTEKREQTRHGESKKKKRERENIRRRRISHACRRYSGRRNGNAFKMFRARSRMQILIIRHVSLFPLSGGARRYAVAILSPVSENASEGITKFATGSSATAERAAS